MWTEEGLQWLLGLAAGQMTQTLVVVGNGQVEAKAEATEVVQSDTEIRVVATFGEDEANFDWSSYGLEVAGVRIVSRSEDQGRKAPGAVWTKEVVVSLTKGE